MDKRIRIYYEVKFCLASREMRIWLLKMIDSVKLHSHPNGWWLVSCLPADSEAVEHLFAKAKCNDSYCMWRNLTREEDFASMARASHPKKSVAFQKGYKAAIKELNTPLLVTTPIWNPTECPRCRKDFSEIEPCLDGYYRRATYLERCPYCGQKLDWSAAYAEKKGEP